MGFTHEDHQELLEKKLKERRQQQAPELRRLMMAGAAVENLIGDERWDYFRSLVQGRVEEFKAQRDEAEGRLHDPFIVKADEVMQAKLARAVASEVVRQLEWVVALPQEVIEAGKQAKKVLDS